MCNVGETVSAQTALKCMGFDLNHPQRGRVLVRTGPIKSKPYSFRYRVGDGHVLYRWGRLVSATYYGVNTFVFDR